MRIGIVINLAPRKLGSLERWLVELCAESRRRGHQVDLFARRPIHPDVEAALAKLSVGFATTDELEASRVTGIRRLAGYDVLHVNMFQPRTPTALLCYAAWPAKIIMVDHTSGTDGIQQLPVRSRGAITNALDKVSLARVDRLIGVSEYVTRRDRKRFSLHPARTMTIYNGVDLQRFASPRQAQPSDHLELAVVAHLTREKGIDVLLRAVAAARNRDLRVRIVGDGRCERQFKALTRELRLEDRVSFLGLRDDVPELLRDSDVLVHPAIWQEAFGLTITEGMAAGCAVIATRVGGIPEIIEHGRSGLLVPPGDVPMLAAEIDLLAENAPLRKRLGDEARARVKAMFDLDACVKAHVEAIEDVAYRDVDVGVHAPSPAAPGVASTDRAQEVLAGGPAAKRSLPSYLGAWLGADRSSTPFRS